MGHPSGLLKTNCTRLLPRLRGFGVLGAALFVVGGCSNDLPTATEDELRETAVASSVLFEVVPDRGQPPLREIPSNPFRNGVDPLVTLYDKEGRVVWTRRLPPEMAEAARQRLQELSAMRESSSGIGLPTSAAPGSRVGPSMSPPGGGTLIDSAWDDGYYYETYGAYQSARDDTWTTRSYQALGQAVHTYGSGGQLSASYVYSFLPGGGTMEQYVPAGDVTGADQGSYLSVPYLDEAACFNAELNLSNPSWWNDNECYWAWLRFTAGAGRAAVFGWVYYQTRFPHVGSWVRREFRWLYVHATAISWYCFNW